MAVETFLPGQEFLAKIRYNHSGAPCKILEVGNDWLRLEFLEPQRAITPGQAVVFYEGDYVFLKLYYFDLQNFPVLLSF